MSASFIKRITSSIVDIVLVFLVVYLAFVVGGRTLLRNRVENFDEIYALNNELYLTYSEDINAIQTEYDANMELANGDPELEALALATYNMKSSILNLQHNIDTLPLNELLNPYLLESIYFYAIGFVFLMTILAVATNGKTPGRWLLKVQLATDRGNGEFGKPNPIQIFFHDIMLKYFFIVMFILITVNLIGGVLFILMTIVVDMILMSFTRNNSTIRDYFLRLRVIKAGYGY